eukprot:jgi/Mesen1/3138/ME000184S02207
MGLTRGRVARACVQERLSDADLGAVLLYFGAEGHDWWCALEVYSWMRARRRASALAEQAMQHMCHRWLRSMMVAQVALPAVRSLLAEMRFARLRPLLRTSAMLLFMLWDRGRAADALLLLKELQAWEDPDPEEQWHALVAIHGAGGVDAVRRVAAALQMAADGWQRRAADDDEYPRGCVGAQEQEKLGTVQDELKRLVAGGIVEPLDEDSSKLLLRHGLRLQVRAEMMVEWAEATHGPTGQGMGQLYEKLVALHCVAGRSHEAQRCLQVSQLHGRQLSADIFIAVASVAAFCGDLETSVSVLRSMEAAGHEVTENAYAALIGGCFKGEHYTHAAAHVLAMVEKGLRPNYQLLSRLLTECQRHPDVYMQLCLALARSGDLDPCLMYLFIDHLNLCIMRVIY